MMMRKMRTNIYWGLTCALHHPEYIDSLYKSVVGITWANTLVKCVAHLVAHSSNLKTVAHNRVCDKVRLLDV